MKTLLAVAAITAAAVAPRVALADVGSDSSPRAETVSAATIATLDAAAPYEIVDPSTGRVLALLMSVPGKPGTLRVVGSGPIAAPAPLAPAAQAAPPAARPSPARAPLTTEEFEALFHDHIGGGG